MHPQLSDLLKAEALWPGKEITRDKTWVEYTDFQSLSDSEKQRLRPSMVVVIDNAKWAWTDSDRKEDGTLQPGTRVMSGNGKLVAQYMNQQKYGEYRYVPKVEGESSVVGFVPVSYVTIFQNKTEATTMSKNEGKLQIDMNALKEEMAASGTEATETNTGADTTGETMERSENFTGEGAETTTAPAAKPRKPANNAPVVSEDITRALSSHETARPGMLWTHNLHFGRMFGYIVDKAEQVQFGLKASLLRDPNGKNVIESWAPTQEKQNFTADGKVDNKYLQKEYSITVKQTRPGRILAVAFGIPMSGFVPTTDFRKAGEIMPIGEDHTLKHFVLPNDVYQTFLVQYFGDGIQEAAETHGTLAGTVEVVGRAGFKKVKGAEKKTNVFNRRLVNRARQSLVIPTNHLPLKTFETIDVRNMSDEEIATANYSAFHSIVFPRVTNTKQKSNNTSKFARLVEEDKNKLVVDEQSKNITSRYFTKDAAEHLTLQVRPYYAPKDGEFLEEVLIPVKQPKQNKDGKSSYPQLVTYNTLDEELQGKPEVRGKLSLFSGKYDGFINAVGEELINTSKLRDLVRRSNGGGAGKNKTLEKEMMMKLELGKALGWISDEQGEMAGQKLQSDEIQQHIYRMQLKATSEQSA